MVTIRERSFQAAAPVRVSLQALVGGRVPGSEEGWMAAYAEGDRRSFDELFRALSPPVHGFLLRTFRDATLADDLLQVTWLKVHAARSQYRKGEPVRPWVMQIAARAALDELRRRKRLAEDGDDEALARASNHEAPGPLPDEALEKSILATKVQAALSRLRESQRIVVLLHRFEGLTFAEIGRTLGISEGSAKLRAFRAYAVLREALSPVASGEDAA